MNQEETSKITTEPESISDSSPNGENMLPAPAQIVEDISADPIEVVESAFPPKENTENSEPERPKTTAVDSSAEFSKPEVYQLLNAMVEKPYQDFVDLRELNIEIVRLSPNFAEQFEKLGLSVKTEGNILRIEGVPSADTQGEHLLRLDYAVDGAEQNQFRELSLLINPDPKSLWKSLEPDESLPYRKDHLATETVVSDNFKIVGASRRGRSHAHEGKFREDDFAIRSLANDWHIVIVADGAGSAKLSRQGSSLAAQTAVEFVENSIAELLEPKFDKLIKEYTEQKTETGENEIKHLLYRVLCGAAFAAYKRLEKESNDTENALKDYSTTFLLSIIKKCAQGFFVASFGIGDGAIGVYSESARTVNLMNSPDGGEFSGQTRFLTMREVVGNGAEMLQRIKFKLFDNFTVLALMTDGISDPKFGTDNNLASYEKWKEFVDELKDIDFSRTSEKTAQELLEYMNFWSPGEHDDRTLVILY